MQDHIIYDNDTPIIPSMKDLLSTLDSSHVESLSDEILTRLRILIDREAIKRGT